MKTLLLLIFISGPLLSQPPYSQDLKPYLSDKDKLKLDVQKPNPDVKPFNQRFRAPENPSRFFLPFTPNFSDEYNMPVKKVSAEGMAMPIKTLKSGNKMNADFYFQQKRSTISDKKD